VQDSPFVPAERDLSRLLATIEPRLQPGTYVFCALEPGATLPPEPAVRMTFREPEGVTVVMGSEDAERLGLAGEFESEWIVIGAASDLAAVGFLAALTSALAEAGIAANVVSAVHHDHLFVRSGQGAAAVAVLEAVQGRGPGRA
jgi:hypothetical protein